MNWAAIRLWVWVLAFAAVDVAASAWADEPVAPAVQPDSAQPAREPVYYGRTSSEWLRLLASGNDRDRAYAVYALERLVPDSPDAARAIAGAVQDLNRDVSVRASETLVRLGPKAQAATSILAAALVDRASEVRERAMAPLDAIGWDKVAVTGLAAAIDDRDTQVSRGAAYKAIGLGRKAEKAAPSLVRALKSPDVEVRYLAAIALVEATPDAKAALPVLIEAARNPVWTIQIEDVPCGGSSRHLVAGTDALRALGKLGPAAKDAIPLFADLLTRPETQSVNPPQSPTILPADGRGAYVSNVRRLASEALAAAGIESLPHLEKALSNSNRDVRALAAAAIGKLGPAASHA
ncbi:MAG: HEAT repeat domain-containing protein, partial [Pirellulales bacterium]